MDEKNKVYEALGQIPELVPALKALIEENEKKDAFLAKAVEAKVEAEVSEEGIQEVIKKVKETIETTPCAAPDVSETSNLFAEAIRKDVKAAVQEAVEEKVASMSINLNHHHTHATTWELAKYADGKVKNVNIFLAWLCAVLVAVITCFLVWYFNSEHYWGSQYIEIVQSEYITEEEQRALRENIYTVDALPKEYETNSKYVKQKIKQIKAILKERERQAKANKGK